MTTKVFLRFLYWVENIKKPSEPIRGSVTLYKESVHKAIPDPNRVSEHYCSISVVDFYNRNTSFTVDKDGVNVVDSTEKGTKRYKIPYKYIRDIYIHGYNNAGRWYFMHKFPHHL